MEGRDWMNFENTEFNITNVIIVIRDLVSNALPTMLFWWDTRPPPPPHQCSTLRLKITDFDLLRCTRVILIFDWGSHGIIIYL